MEYSAAARVTQGHGQLLQDIEDIENMVLRFREGLKLANEEVREDSERTARDMYAEVEGLNRTIAIQAQFREKLLAEYRKLEELEKLKWEEAQLTGALGEFVSEDTHTANKLQETLKEFQYKTQMLREQEDMYCQTLGLEVNRVENGTCFSFKWILREDEARKHRVVLLCANGVYRVVECVPGLGSIEQLEMLLNTTNDFPQFIKDVRQSFTQLYI